jgi:iron complex outermembrane receptor protein
MRTPHPFDWILLGTVLLLSPERTSARDADPPDSLEAPDPRMEEIVVTGTRIPARLIDVPYAMERVTMAEQPFGRKVGVDDVLDEVPGLFLQSRYGNHDVRISIRGYGSRSNTGIRGVRILLDGIPESEPDGQTRIEAIDFQAVGTIEIVKGNASSVYTNAPGGVINFISDVGFPKSSFVSFNQFGSFDLRQNGFKSGIRTDRYGLLTTYSYHHAEGYREHSDDYWHIANTALEINPHDTATLRIYGYLADGRIRLPGSLTREQFAADPLQANERDVARDTKRISRKGRLGLRYGSEVGEDEVEVTAYATMKYFERTAATYRVINRDGLGASARYVHRREWLGRRNELSGAVDWFYQYGPIQAYENINGRKSDILLGLTDEKIGNTGFYVASSFDLVPDRLSLLLTARYDHVFFEAKNQILEVQNATRTFDDFTPKAALNLKLTPRIAVYTSYGTGFDTPAGNELDNFPTSSDPNALLNPDLQPQKSRNFELGVRGSVARLSSAILKRCSFGASFFALRVEDEIVPFDVFGDAFFRNSAATDRHGLEVGLDATVVEGLQFRGAYTFSDFTYDEYAAGTVGIDSLGNIVIAGDDFSGNEVPSVPKHNLSLSLAYEREIARRVTGFAKVHYSATGGMYPDDANTERTDGYQIVDPTVGMDAAIGPLSLQVSAGVNNLFDETYVGFVNINSATREFYEAGEPRSGYVALNLGGRF